MPLRFERIPPCPKQRIFLPGEPKDHKEKQYAGQQAHFIL
jgi:hypothetical protein